MISLGPVPSAADIPVTVQIVTIYDAVHSQDATAAAAAD